MTTILLKSGIKKEVNESVDEVQAKLIKTTNWSNDENAFIYLTHNDEAGSPTKVIIRAIDVDMVY